MFSLTRLSKSNLRTIFAVLLLFISVYYVQVCFKTTATLFSSTSSIPPSWKQSIGLVRSKEIVVASLKDDDTSWVAEHLSDWNANIYVVDDPRSELTVPMNKARESMVYLTYIIDRFEKLPDVMIFVHSNRYQWHNDDPIYDAVPIIQSLRLPHVYKVGYAPLRCTWIPGCPAELHPLNPTDTGPEDRQRSEIEYAAAFEKMLPNMPVPPVVGAPCSSQFAVTRNQVMKRSKESYELIRRWVMETDLPDAVCGRVMEYMWHIIMQMPPVYCPPAAECYCMTFGLCNLTCSSVAKCENRYILPTHSRIPEGWPEEGGGENGWPSPGWNEL
ncbi:conserved hypothetical protein [Histoplasma capsulatum var. duboisii H88]|uniref:DUF3431 superfamily domain-containing protein n=1 Tax=Ajellomyces capsulatus (strain H88) TaxID=544711 RepID=F0UUM5_AJEC8|nr:conserved hypothetical protein [Histoplasma capsulatum var. duboisii H88]QSS57561.1 DUF3431 superfamily domain-containing protein [Histoplasma capsulatum var. duboisii H88]